MAFTHPPLATNTLCIPLCGSNPFSQAIQSNNGKKPGMTKHIWLFALSVPDKIRVFFLTLNISAWKSKVPLSLYSRWFHTLKPVLTGKYPCVILKHFTEMCGVVTKPQTISNLINTPVYDRKVICFIRMNNLKAIHSASWHWLTFQKGSFQAERWFSHLSNSNTKHPVWNETGYRCSTTVVF